MFVFNHIEKAAGMSVHTVLARNFASYYRAAPFKVNPKEWIDDPYLSVKQLRRFRLLAPWINVMGGHPFKAKEVVECFPHALQLVFLREPCSRFVSHYHYQKEVMGVDWDFDDFCSVDGYSNFMCRKISGKPDFYSAKKVLESGRFVFGLVESFQESIDSIFSEMYINDIISKKMLVESDRSFSEINSRKSRGDSDSCDVDYELVERNNSEDVRLYRYIVENLWPKQIQRKNKLWQEMDIFDFDHKDNMSLHLWFTAYYRFLEKVTRFNGGYSTASSIFSFGKK